MMYDELSELYRTDPDLFEVRTRELLEDLINTFPKERQERARQLQWRIDQTLSHYKDPVARMNKMIEMFWEGVSEFNDVLHQKPRTQKAAVVLPFPNS